MTLALFSQAHMLNGEAVLRAISAVFRYACSCGKFFVPRSPSLSVLPLPICDGPAVFSRAVFPCAAFCGGILCNPR